MNKIIPLCHKCEHGLWAKLKGCSVNGRAYKGCAEDHRIDDSNKDTLCPLLPEFRKKQKKDLTSTK